MCLYGNRKIKKMKDHYDFSKGVRCKFYRPDAVFRLPVYRNEDVERYLAARATAKGVDISELDNDLLRHDIENAERLHISQP
jgi:hypothetical protein